MQWSLDCAKSNSSSSFECGDRLKIVTFESTLWICKGLVLDDDDGNDDDDDLNSQAGG